MDLVKYKMYLISHHNNQRENTKEKRNQRKEILERKFSDEELSSIIDSTDRFSLELIRLAKEMNGFVCFNIDHDAVSYINLGLENDKPSDKLVRVGKNTTISAYCLRRIFGSQLMFGVRESVIPEESEWCDYLGDRHVHYVIMRGFPDNLDEIKDQLQESQIVK